MASPPAKKTQNASKHFDTSRKLLKNRNETFAALHYLTQKLECLIYFSHDFGSSLPQLRFFFHI